MSDPIKSRGRPVIYPERTVGVRISADNYRWLEVLAKTMNVSLTGAVNMILDVQRNGIVIKESKNNGQ